MKLSKLSKDELNNIIDTLARKILSDLETNLEKGVPVPIHTNDFITIMSNSLSTALINLFFRITSMTEEQTKQIHDDSEVFNFFIVNIQTIHAKLLKLRQSKGKH